MAIVDVPHIWFPPPSGGATSSIRYRNETLTAVGHFLGTVFEAPSAGDITGIGFATRTVTTGDDLDCRLESVDATDGEPTGALIGTNTNATQTILASDDNTWFDVTFTSAYTTTKGQLMCAKVAAPSGYAGNMDVASVDRVDSATEDFPYEVNSTGKVGGQFQVLAVNYGGTYYSLYNVYPVTAIANGGFNSADTPDERGIYFRVPYGCRACGFWLRCDRDNACDVILYDSDGSTVLQSVSLDSDIRVANNKTNEFHYFGGRSTLTANTWYRLVVKPTTTSDVTLNRLDFNSNAILGQLPGGTDVYETERTNGGAWTQTNTRRSLLGIILDGVETGGSSSGARNPLRGPL